MNNIYLNSLERYKNIVENWEEFINNFNNPLPYCMWTNNIRTSPAELNEIMHEHGAKLYPFSWQKGAFRISNLDMPQNFWPYITGLLCFQDEFSLIPTKLLDPKVGERILDISVSPKFRSLAIASAMGNRGTFFANFTNSSLRKKFELYSNRLSLVNTCFSETKLDSINDDFGFFDKIIVDAPSTNEGNVANINNYDDLSGYRDDFVSEQFAMIKKAISLTKIGGRILYCNDSFAPEENEAVVNLILEEFGEYVKLTPAAIKGLKHSKGILEWQGKTFNKTLDQTMRIWPHQNNTNGGFFAIFQKIAEKNHSENPQSYFKKIDILDSDDEQLKEIWNYLATNFGLEKMDFGQISFYYQKENSLFCTTRDVRAPTIPNLIVGKLFISKDGNSLNLTTEMCFSLASKMRKNTVDLNIEQIKDYLQGKTFNISLDQARACQRDGVVCVRYKRHGLGFAELNTKEDYISIKSKFPTMEY